MDRHHHSGIATSSVQSSPELKVKKFEGNSKRRRWMQNSPVEWHSPEGTQFIKIDDDSENEIDNVVIKSKRRPHKESIIKSSGLFGTRASVDILKQSAINNVSPNEIQYPSPATRIENNRRARDYLRKRSQKSNRKQNLSNANLNNQNKEFAEGWEVLVFPESRVFESPNEEIDNPETLNKSELWETKTMNPKHIEGQKHCMKIRSPRGNYFSNSLSERPEKQSKVKKLVMEDWGILDSDDSLSDVSNASRSSKQASNMRSPRMRLASNDQHEISWLEKVQNKENVSRYNRTYFNNAPQRKLSSKIQGLLDSNICSSDDPMSSTNGGLEPIRSKTIKPMKDKSSFHKGVHWDMMSPIKLVPNRKDHAQDQSEPHEKFSTIAPATQNKKCWEDINVSEEDSVINMPNSDTKVCKENLGISSQQVVLTNTEFESGSKQTLLLSKPSADASLGPTALTARRPEQNTTWNSIKNKLLSKVGRKLTVDISNFE